MNRRKLHLLSNTLMLSLCSMVCGAGDLEKYGHEKGDYLKIFLPLSNRILSQDTINKIFRLMHTGKFEECLIRFSKEIRSFVETEGIASQQINVDGKVLRGTAKSGNRKSGLCLISAFTSVQGFKFRSSGNR